ncbi:MAG: DEAD/DEAH box helicase [candidate division KSB1 bacterium]|nr:DEAD/DEAH box helicase [candidate division KSB1 bacterium]MDZ7367365.1 DEAD/DEAH box helicase [candidate division KSB1 bacterium]MDZ7405246.1 DEAD/DEAH box helicase [candidate division KSB1 bacterium]
MPSKTAAEIPLSFSFHSPNHLAPFAGPNGDGDLPPGQGLAAYRAKLDLYHLALLREFDELLCLDTLRNIERYWYQIETVKKVLKHFRGRVLLSDEVGLGKTIEAGMLIKEYRLRGLVKKALILVPPALVSQWQEEMREKFDLDFITSDDVEVKRHPDFWEKNDWVIASLHTAKNKANFDLVTQIKYDLVVVDEAHHLKNKTTLSWKLVNALQKKFIFLLTATPVQNDLMELHNLLTLLKPGVLKTEAQFRKEYVARGDVRMPKNRESLKELLREVMIRNTRSLVDVKLPKRFATTITVQPSQVEKDLYERITQFARSQYGVSSGLEKMTLNHLLMKAGSCPFALEDSLLNLKERMNGAAGQIDSMLDLLKNVRETEKGRQLLQLVRKSSAKKIVFTNFLRTFDYLAGLFREAGIPFVEFRSGMTNEQKDAAIEQFRGHTDLLLMTEIGAEGRNLQFCQTMINYDLPWNPMRLEQRIGRIHRIGQTNDVFVFNFCIKDSIEEYILYILDKKINMFELVIGEIDSILGNLGSEEEFSDIVLDIWLRSTQKDELHQNIENFAEQILQARAEYQKTKELDEALFEQEFEV